jgi:hypothetical protein
MWRYHLGQLVHIRVEETPSIDVRLTFDIGTEPVTDAAVLQDSIFVVRGGTVLIYSATDFTRFPSQVQLKHSDSSIVFPNSRHIYGSYVHEWGGIGELTETIDRNGVPAPGALTTATRVLGHDSTWDAWSRSDSGSVLINGNSIALLTDRGWSRTSLKTELDSYPFAAVTLASQQQIFVTGLESVTDSLCRYVTTEISIDSGAIQLVEELVRPRLEPRDVPFHSIDGKFHSMSSADVRNTRSMALPFPE